MKASALIKQLIDHIDAHGDVECAFGIKYHGAPLRQMLSIDGTAALTVQADGERMLHMIQLCSDTAIILRAQGHE